MPTAKDSTTPQDAGAITLSVIVVNWNAAQYLPAMLQTLNRALAGLAAEIIVVDNASTDASLALLRESYPPSYPPVNVVANAQNRGFAAANNQGIQLARGRYLLLLNPDTEIPTTALHRLLAYLEQHPGVGVLGPRLVGIKGKVQGGAAGYDPSPFTIFNHATFLYRLFPGRLRGLWLPQETYLRPQPVQVDWVSGACMLVRRAAAAAAGSLDESYFMYSEDVEWCRRIRKAGYEIVCHPGITIMHHIGGSSRQMGSDFYAHNVDSLDRDLRSRYPALVVRILHLVNSFGFLLRTLHYEVLWRRSAHPAYHNLRDVWAACLHTSLVRALAPGLFSPPGRDDLTPTPPAPPPVS